MPLAPETLVQSRIEYGSPGRSKCAYLSHWWLESLISSSCVTTLLDSLKSNLYLILFGRILPSDRIIAIWLTNVSSKNFKSQINSQEHKKKKKTPFLMECYFYWDHFNNLAVLATETTAINYLTQKYTEAGCICNRNWLCLNSATNGLFVILFLMLWFKKRF